MHKTDKEKKAFVDKHLAEIFPQLQENMKKVCGRAYDRWGDDLLQLSLEFFLNKPLDVQYDACFNNRAENFCTYIANFQLKSSTSRHWHTHRKFLGQTRELFVGTYDYDYDNDFDKPFEDEISDLQDCINKQMKDLNPYEKMLIQEKVQWGSKFTDIAKKYNIPYNSLSTGLKRTLNKIKEKCQHLR